MEINCESNTAHKTSKHFQKTAFQSTKGISQRRLGHFPYLNNLVVVGSIRFINGLQEGPRVLVSFHHI